MLSLAFKNEADNFVHPRAFVLNTSALDILLTYACGNFVIYMVMLLQWQSFVCCCWHVCGLQHCQGTASQTTVFILIVWIKPALSGLIPL
ncbi:hypothetical protein [Rhodopila sp.]|uniref:hypothetical protein n=1 Tax=Rhodopila sp. TaxID=2480087 RepID=UPI003D108D8D